MKFALKLGAGAIGMALAVTAHAQTNLPPAPPPRQQTQVPPPAQSSSDALSHSGGVICPPVTGDEGVMPPPNTDRAPMPEMRPPGTPGGNPDVHPK